MRKPRIVSAIAPDSALRGADGAPALRDFLAAEADFLRGDSESALQRMRTALASHKPILSQHDHVVLWVELARYLLALGSAEGVEKLHALATKISSDEPLVAAGILVNAGRLLAEADRFGDAEASFDVAAHTFMLTGEVRAAADAMRELGHVALFAEHPLRALVAWQGALALAQIAADAEEGARVEIAVARKVVSTARELARSTDDNAAADLLDHARAIDAATGGAVTGERPNPNKKAVN